VIPIVPVEVIVPPVIGAVVAIDVTVPPDEGEEFVMVKFGYVPVTEIPVPAVSATVWSGAVLVNVNVSVTASVVTEIPVPDATVSVSSFISATIVDCPDTAMFLNMY
jgi:hypothetical protein